MSRPQRKERPWDARKRECIQDAVIQLMSREGLRAVTMERVAHEVGIAKGTVYLHYRDKQQLLDAAKEAALDPLMERCNEVLDSTLDPLSKLEMFALRYVGYFDERREFFRVLLYEREVTRTTGSRYRTDRYRHLIKRLGDVIQLGIDAGRFRQVDATKAAAMYLEANLAIVHQRLLSEDRSSVERDAQLISGIFESGLQITTTRGNA